jgi:hypothetical protein
VRYGEHLLRGELVNSPWRIGALVSSMMGK